MFRGRMGKALRRRAAVLAGIAACGGVLWVVAWELQPAGPRRAAAAPAHPFHLVTVWQVDNAPLPAVLPPLIALDGPGRRLFLPPGAELPEVPPPGEGLLVLLRLDSLDRPRLTQLHGVASGQAVAWPLPPRLAPGGRAAPGDRATPRGGAAAGDDAGNAVDGAAAGRLEWRLLSLDVGGGIHFELAGRSYQLPSRGASGLLWTPAGLIDAAGGDAWRDVARRALAARRPFALVRVVDYGLWPAASLIRSAGGAAAAGAGEQR